MKNDLTCKELKCKHISQICDAPDGRGQKYFNIALVLKDE